MSVQVQKIPGGFRIDGLELKSGRCGCTSIARCCYSWSRVKKRKKGYEFIAKMTAPDTKENHDWGYTVKKEDVVITVKVEDAQDKEIYSGYLPPFLTQWNERGWETVGRKLW
ncbi:MAG: hypothetical protein GXO99_04980 [Nitrospirae bacterium]|nr:hypothetical protein [Nitrospirota bacterium]